MANVTVADVAALIEAAKLTKSTDADQIWILLAGFLVFFMHLGFTMLEAGSVRHKAAVNILFKNVSTIAIGAICYFVLGFALAYGDANAPAKFIGSGRFAGVDFANDMRHTFFFQFAFAATAATIVSGAVAGRINLIAYFIMAAYLTLFVYPVVSHWVWATGGWLSAFQWDGESPNYKGEIIEATEPLFASKGGCGMIDYAGSGVVHLTGGVAAMVGAFILGPRLGRFADDGTPVDIPPHNISLQTLGVFVLWFGWYGFNCGSTLAFDGANASKVAVTTTLAPSAAVIVGIILGRVLKGHFDISATLNCALAGLVSITAGCSTVDDGSAILIGALGGVFYFGASKLMLKLKIDDPVDAVAVHGFCGIWGCLAVGIFATPENIAVAYGSACEGNTSGLQFGVQLIGVLAIIGWVLALTAPVFIVLKVTGLLRVSSEDEEAGLDVSEHGGSKVFVGDAVISPEA